jgi:ABC-type multidrug transport system fused ATPase/permease subunit
MACGIGFAMVNGCLPLIAKYVGEHVFNSGATQTEIWQAAQANEGQPLNTSIVFICLLIPATMILRSILSYLNTYYMAWVSLRVLSDMRQRLFEHLISQSLDACFYGLGYYKVSTLCNSGSSRTGAY